MQIRPVGAELYAKKNGRINRYDEVSNFYANSLKKVSRCFGSF